MKKVIWLASLLSVMCLLIPSIVWAEAVVSIDPAEIQSPVAGETLEVDIVITGAENVSGFQTKVVYDATALDYNEVVEGDFLKSVGFTFMTPPKKQDGAVLLGVALLGAGASGDGTLMTVKFNVVEKKDSMLELDVALSDPDANPISATVEGAKIIGEEVQPEPVIAHVISVIPDDGSTVLADTPITVQFDNPVDSCTIAGKAATLSSGNKEAKIDDAGLSEGSQTVTIEWTNKDGSTDSYTVTYTVEPYENVFFTSLESGLNMISLPLKPIKPYTARSLAEKIDATVVIKLDEARQRLVGFTIDDPGDGFPIEGGKGYIVNVEEGKTVKFGGSAWTNQPPIEAAPSEEGGNSAWAFVVNVSMEDAGYRIQVENQSTGASSMTEALGNSRYSGVWADLTRQPVVKVGDVLEVAVSDNTGTIGILPYTVTKKDIRRAFVTIPLDTHTLRPMMTMLYQNYPNPFNPETWIPYHLAQDAPVIITIYNAQGQLVRLINLGRQPAGIYVSKSRAAHWDGRNNVGEYVASGLYFYSIRAGKFSATRRMLLIK